LLKIEVSRGSESGDHQRAAVSAEAGEKQPEMPLFWSQSRFGELKG
jgi:hypothetical protein